MRNTRLEEMEKYILQNDSVSMEQLCEQFSVSMITVRRDIAQLQRKGTIEKNTADQAELYQQIVNMQ